MDLADRLVTLPSWRWLPGMLVAGGARVTPTTIAVAPHARPNLYDPPTIGCLFSMYEDTRLRKTCPDPVYTTAAIYGFTHPLTIAAIVEALEAA